MQRVSSIWTFFLKIVLPIIWVVFIGSLTAVGFFVQEASVQMGGLRYLLLACLAIGSVLLFFTLMSLKRVEVDQHFVYVNNFFKMYRYPYHNIESITTNKYAFVKIGKLRFKQAGHFGKSVFFILSEPHWLAAVAAIEPLAKLVSQRPDRASG
jgi:hypothetical protein